MTASTLNGAQSDEAGHDRQRAGREAEIDRDDAGRKLLGLCNCPMPGLVAATRAPRLEELGFVKEMHGELLSRVSYIPAGDAACCYVLGET
jgi:hypothetical protein